MNSKKLMFIGLTTISVILVFVMFTAVASAAPPEITSFAPPSPVYDDTCALRTFNVTLDQTVNVNWYLDDSLLFTDVSVTEAKCSLKTYVTGEHNVSAIAANQNGTDMQTWIWNVAGGGGCKAEIHRYWYRDEEVHIDEIHRTVEGYAHYDLGPSFYSNDWDIWHVGSWSDLTAGEIAYLDTVTGLSAGIWYYIDLLNQTVDITPFENYSEESGREVTEEIIYEDISPYTVLVTHTITTTVTYKDHCYQLIVKVEDVTTGAPNITSFAPPSPVSDHMCAWRTFNVTLDQTVNVNWYLDDSLLFTNVSVTEAKCSLRTYVTEVHNVSAIATNQNGTDMQTWIWNVEPTVLKEIHRYWYRDEEEHIEEIHRTVAGYAHYDLGPSFYSNDWDIWHVGSWSDLTAGEIAYLDTVTGLSAGIWYYIDLLNQTVAITPFENYPEEIGRVTTEEIIYECLDEHTVHVTHIITTTVTYKDHIYQLIVKVEDVTTGAPKITSFAPPSPVNDTVCSWRAFNVTVNQTVNVSWYLNNTLQHTNVSTKEASYTLHAEVVGEHNVSAIASNENGTDMQSWVWNVTAAPVLNCTCGDICVNETGWWCDGGAFNPSGTPIQDAIDNASVCCGAFSCENPCTICVKDGTYTENVDVGTANLVIKSENGSANCIVQAADSNDHVFHVDADCVTIQGFNVTGATDEGKAGIHLGSPAANNCNILGNHVWLNYYGIELLLTSNNVISGNTVNDNEGWVGIYLNDSNENKISGNTVNDNEECGIALWESNENKISGNTVTHNDEFGIALGERSNENEISGNTVTHNGWYGIYLVWDASNNKISGNTVNDNRDGIYLEDASNNKISGNTVNDNVEIGIYLYDASNNKISGNTVNDNEYGIYLYDASNNKISGNTVNDNEMCGIALGESNENEISGNTVNDNEECGIALRESNENEISGNTVMNNEWYGGIGLVDASNNVITCNLVAYNTENGFYLTEHVADTSTGNTIEDNNIIENGVYNAETGGWEWNFHNKQSANVAAEHNYWVTAVPSEIAASIWEDPGTVDYEPFLSDPSTCAPKPPVRPVASIDIEKWVKYKAEPEREYLKAIDDAKVCDNVILKIVIHNDGSGTNLTEISITDVLSDSLGYRGNANVHFPNGTTSEIEPVEVPPKIYQWQFAGVWLEPCEYLNITFDAHVDECGNDTNHVAVKAVNETGYSVADEDTVWVNCTGPMCVETATGTGIACFETDAGTNEDLVAVDESTLPAEGKPALVFPHGFFSFDITGLTSGQTVIVTIQLPDNVPVGTQYWKYHASEGGWIQIPMGSDDGDKVITITLVDGGLGDDDGTANGVIVDQGGPGIPNPDLTIIGIWFSKNPCCAGDDIEIIFEVKNQDNGDAGPHQDCLLIDGFEGKEFSSSGLKAGETQSWYYLYEDVPSTPDPHVIDVCSDCYGDVEESNEYNNCDSDNLKVIEPKKPDLVITGKLVCWPDNCTICYNVTNIGEGTAPACHNTTLYVEGVEVAHDHVPLDLAPGESYTGCFNDYEWGYTPPSDNITVCADNTETLDELDETNNCLTNIWMCGDVNCDGKVTMSDVRKVFNRYLDPNYLLDSPWAADVNCDGKVTMSDVRKVFNRYLDPGYELNCCCEGVGWSNGNCSIS